MTRSSNEDYTVVELENWKRKLHYSLFKDALIPYYNVCVDLGITKFLTVVKEKGWSFTLSFVHTVSTVAN